MHEVGVLFFTPVHHAPSCPWCWGRVESSRSNRPTFRPGGTPSRRHQSLFDRTCWRFALILLGSFVRTALQAGRRSCVPVLPETDTRSCLKFAWSLHRVRLGEDLQLGISKDQRVLLTIRTFSFPSESRSPCAPSIDQSKSPHSRWLRTTGDLPSLSPYNSLALSLYYINLSISVASGRTRRPRVVESPSAMVSLHSVFGGTVV